MRNAFAQQITELAEEDGRVVLLMGDIGNRLFDRYKEICPERFFNCGVGEANMVSTAAGLAASGLKPVCYTIAPFVTARAYEQIRIDLCYHDVPCVVVGTGAGLSYASLGATHHSFDDLALMRVLPGMTVFCPGDALEVRACLKLALREGGPSYLRLGKKNEPVVHAEEPQLETGKFFRTAEGSDACFLSCGNMLPSCMAAAKELELQGVSAEVMSCFNVKPLDEDYLRKAFARFRLVATVEEHSRIGGFGSAVAEWLADREEETGGARARLIRFAIPDTFFHRVGEQEYLREACGLGSGQIVARLLEEFAGASSS